MGEVEGVGDAVTGAMLARAIEAEAGESDAQGNVCLNCRTPLAGRYCHQCGQAARVRRSLAAIGHDIAHSVLHFEGKIWRTLPLLAWRPGELTRRYIAGERARFVSPMALFLFSVFLMFAIFSLIGPSISPSFETDRASREELVASRDAAASRMAALERQLATPLRQGEDRKGLEADLAEARAELTALSTLTGMTGGDGGTNLNVNFDSGGVAWLDAAYRNAKQNPSLLVYKLQANGYKFSWALIPISVPFVWLLFAFRRQYGGYDHTVFVTYSISFMTLFVIAFSLLSALGLTGGWFALALLLVPPLHMYRQLRGAYRLSRLSAAWRAVLLSIFAVFAAILFFILLVLVGIS